MKFLQQQRTLSLACPHLEETEVSEWVLDVVLNVSLYGIDQFKTD